MAQTKATRQGSEHEAGAVRAARSRRGGTRLHSKAATKRSLIQPDELYLALMSNRTCREVATELGTSRSSVIRAMQRHPEVVRAAQHDRQCHIDRLRAHVSSKSHTWFKDTVDKALKEVELLQNVYIMRTRVTLPGKEAITSQLISMEKRKRNREKQRRRRARLRAAGLCPNCAEPPKPGNIYCGSCRFERKAKTQ